MIWLQQGDCLELMKNIPDGSVDLVLTDPPYGTTACKWDSVIPFEPMWEQLNRIIKSNGAICLFGSEPFSSKLRMSNLKMFKYDWIWDKVNRYTGYGSCKYAPLRRYEIISLFANNVPTYNPQMAEGKPYKKTGDYSSQIYGTGKIKKQGWNVGTRYPFNILQFKGDDKKNGHYHPTQKPVQLLEYLIRTYTNDGETVLDFTMGSGSTGVACVNLKRNFIGMEIEEEYFKIAKERINNARFNQQTGGCVLSELRSENVCRGRRSMRLIDADELRKSIEDLPNCYNGFSDTYDKACIIGVLEELPTVEPVKHGRWEKIGHIENTWLVSKCSECGYQTIDAGNYCPNCGAKMDLEGEKE